MLRTASTAIIFLNYMENRLNITKTAIISGVLELWYLSVLYTQYGLAMPFYTTKAKSIAKLPGLWRIAHCAVHEVRYLCGEPE